MDNRRKQGRRYELGYVLLFSIFGILSGATSYRKIHSFIEDKYEVLNEYFELGWKKVPAYTTIRNIIQGTSGSELEREFRAYSAELAGKEDVIRFVKIDGKTIRGSFDHFSDKKAVQILSAFVGESRLILAHEEIADKTNEIPVAQELIEALGLSGSIFTFDALHCQEKTLEVAKESGNEVIVQVKDNQPTLLEDCKTISQTTTPHEVYQESVTKAHGRLETRTVSVFVDPQLTHNDKWKFVDAIVVVERHRELFDTRSKIWKTSDTTAFYISTTILGAEIFCQAIRGHWDIENGNHYVRDVALQEDASRIRKNPHIFARLRSFALNILRANNVHNVTLELFRNCCNFNYILNYQGIA